MKEFEHYRGREPGRAIEVKGEGNERSDSQPAAQLVAGTLQMASRAGLAVAERSPILSALSYVSPAQLAAETGFPIDRVDAAVATLSVDGLVEVDAGHVRLAS